MGGSSLPPSLPDYSLVRVEKKKVGLIGLEARHLATKKGGSSQDVGSHPSRKMLKFGNFHSAVMTLSNRSLPHIYSVFSWYSERDIY